jgi:cell filamentation protein
MNQEEHEKLAGILSANRIFELYLNPVRGDFDTAHLKEIHRRIFQDLPAHGINGYTPGEFRSSTPPDKLHNKTRNLQTTPAQSYIGYSWMNEEAIKDLDKILENANPVKFSRLKTDDFSMTMSSLYAQLDYIHPFREGNSRTLRTFTRQLARESGYDLDWIRFNATAGTRDSLYIARDKAVSKIVLAYLPESEVKYKIMDSVTQFKNRPDLHELIRGAVRPLRAIAFEKSSEEKALKAYPELNEAFKTLRKAEQYFKAKMPGSASGQETALKTVKDCIQARLDEGETQGFEPARQAEEKKRRPARIKDDPDLER